MLDGDGPHEEADPGADRWRVGLMSVSIRLQIVQSANAGTITANNVQREQKKRASAGQCSNLIDPPPLLSRLHSSILRVRQKSRQPS